MGELPRPTVADTALAALFDALHRLHHEAGWPSLRTMAREVGCSHTTVAAAFSEPRAPRWGLLELIVETLGGDTSYFHRLWLDATTPPHHVADLQASGSGGVVGGSPPPHDLPADVSAFTGRADQLQGLDRLLEPDGAAASVGVCAISGTAGVGKTALAVHWAHRVVDRFPDGQLYINLRGYDLDRPVPPGEALGAFLRELGLADSAVPYDVAERAAKYRTLLAGRKVLVVLDNASSVQQVADLLPGASSCFTVVTSRDTLPSLIARYGAVRLNLDLLTLGESIDLLHRLVGDRVTSDPERAIRLAALCVRLPLALRIVAEYAITRPRAALADLVTELEDETHQLDMLAAGDDDRTSVRSVFSWSLRSLRPSSAHTFALLGLHPGRTFDVGAVAALTAGTAGDARDVVAELVRAHLVNELSPHRFGLHDLLRVYAAERAAGLSDNERQAATIRLFDHYTSTAAAAMTVAYPQGNAHRPVVDTGGHPGVSFDRPDSARGWLDVERQNLLATARAGVDRSPSHPGQLAAVLPDYLDARAHFGEALELQNVAIEAARKLDDRPGEATALDAKGHVLRRIGRYHDAREHHQRALSLFEELGDTVRAGHAEHGLGIVSWRLGHYESARHHLGRALATYRETGDHAGEGNVLQGLGVVYRRLGRLDDAVDHYTRSIDVHRRIGDRQGECRATNNLGIVMLRLGRYDDAHELYQGTLATYRELGDLVGEGVVLTNIGLTLERLGRFEAAIERHREAISIYQKAGYRVGLGDGYQGIGVAFAGLGDYTRAEEHLRKALAISHELGEASLEAGTLNELGRVFQATERPEEAREHHTMALDIAIDNGDQYEHARALDGLARLSAAGGDPAEARRQWQLAVEIFASLGLPEADALRPLVQ
ncbi:ATP-binding protein [Phytoactinopolyspora limicola]|uniref:ATP-binding protein n=1 Tax=Phytoactinopolyspora limicola TaxID=2715536 RepID=UPI00140B7347|nr:tetratricopeptide repeat protein [Phytoactinopolyspora limicola]